MFGSSLLMTYAVSMAIHMRRIEGRFPALAMIQFGLGAIFVLELIQLLNDMAWIPFVGLTSTAVVQVACFGIAVLFDRRASPIFPRWLGYYNLWVALMFMPGTFNVFFHDGPLAWNGIVAWYIPLAVFATWLVINPIYLSRAVDGMDEDEQFGFDDNGSAGSELRRLRADVDDLRRMVAR